MKSDYLSENALISILLQAGFESYHDIATLGISEDSFYQSNNKILYKCLEHLFENENVKNVDLPLIINSGKSLGYDKWIEQESVTEYIEELLEYNVRSENARKFAQKLRKLEVANNIGEALSDIEDDLDKVTGDEKMSDIFGIVENKLSHLASFLNDSTEDPVNLGSSMRQHVEDIINNPKDQLGIPTGYDIFDKSIGGGLRRHAITVIAARAKVGKSTFCKNVGWNIAKQGIPVLILDTEMETEDQSNRLLSSVSDTPLSDIETGKFVSNLNDKNRIDEALVSLDSANIFHKNIAGMPLEAQLAIARKWIIQKVGLQKDGKAKECVLVYDYIKMMDSKNLNKMQEHQAIGFLMTALQNFAVKYDIPILTAAQLNRDGIETESTAAISASDRIAMYCSSISILKWKSGEELDAENYQYGNQKLIPIISRYGPPMEDGNYINIDFNHIKNQMKEKGLKSNSQPTTSTKQKRGNKQKEEVSDMIDF